MKKWVFSVIVFLGMSVQASGFGGGGGGSNPDQPIIPDLSDQGEAQLTAYEAGDAAKLGEAKATAAEIRKWRRKCGTWGKANYDSCTLDNDITQGALRFLMRLDRVTKFSDKKLTQDVQSALSAIIKDQYKNGAFCQHTGIPSNIKKKSDAQPANLKASIPSGYPKPYDKYRKPSKPEMEYPYLYTFNDDAMIRTATVLWIGADTYGKKDYSAAALKVADFILNAQMPAPQRGWAQQYNFKMQPEWARAHEPPALSSRETHHILLFLVEAKRRSKLDKYCAPIPAALDWLLRSFEEEVVGQPNVIIGPRWYEMVSNKRMYLNGRDDDGNGHFEEKKENVDPELMKKDVNHHVIYKKFLQNQIQAQCTL